MVHTTEDRYPTSTRLETTLLKCLFRWVVKGFSRSIYHEFYRISIGRCLHLLFKHCNIAVCWKWAVFLSVTKKDALKWLQSLRLVLFICLSDFRAGHKQINAPPWVGGQSLPRQEPHHFSPPKTTIDWQTRTPDILWCSASLTVCGHQNISIPLNLIKYLCPHKVSVCSFV